MTKVNIVGILLIFLNSLHIVMGRTIEIVIIILKKM